MVSGVQEQFEQFLAERMPVLVQFAEALGSPEPHRILNEPHLFAAGISDWLAHQTVGDEDRPWLLSRLGYFIGEYLVIRFGGLWFVCEAADSKFCGRYVVGQFTDVKNTKALADPFEVAVASLEPGAPALQELLAEVSHALQVA
jgi:hypothetical protein